MSNKIFQLLKVCLAVLMVTVAMPACQDDHFDVKTGGEHGNATKTLWEQIQANPDLSKFAAIAEKVPYFKDEAHPQKNYTFKDVLNGSQVLTVFAPTNDAISQAVYDEYMQLCETDPYNVFLRFVGNHIAKNRFQVSVTANAENFRLINNKKATFSPQEKLFQGVRLTESNIPATNGLLHKLSSEAPFAFNIYEYIKSNGAMYDSLKVWIVEHDTIYFNEELSAEGAPDKDGNPVYVDSVYTRKNILWQSSYKENDGTEWMFSLKGFGADLECEDSVFAMALPTSVAWANAMTAITPYYNYASVYPDKRREDEGTDDATPFECNPDSLKRLAMRMDIAAPLVYNCRTQLRTPGHTGFWTASTFNSTPMPKIFNMHNDTTTHTVDSVEQDAKTLIFNDTTKHVYVSNGVVYPVENWNVLKADGAKDVEMKLGFMSVFKSEDLGTTSFERVSFVNANSALVQDSLLGGVKEDYFYSISNGNSSPNIQLKIRDHERNHQIYSNLKYKVYFVMVPDFYKYNPDSIIVNPSVPADTIIKKNRFNVEISYVTGNVSSKGKPEEKKETFKNIEYDGRSVQMVEVGEFTFPVSYRNLTYCYPTMKITSSAKNTDVTKNRTYVHSLCIDRIIFKAQE